MSSKGGPLVGVVVAVLIVAAIGSIAYYQVEVAPHLNTTTTSTSATTQASCTPSTCVNVTIPSGASTPNAEGYLPGTVTVVIGVNNTVVWTNADQAPHTVTATDNSFNSLGQFPSGMVQGDAFSYTFKVAGTYQYSCTFHGWMRGTVIVKNA